MAGGATLALRNVQDAPSRYVVLCEHVALAHEASRAGCSCPVPERDLVPVFIYRPTPVFEQHLCRACAYDLRAQLNQYADADVHRR